MNTKKKLKQLFEFLYKNNTKKVTAFIIIAYVLEAIAFAKYTLKGNVDIVEKLGDISDSSLFVLAFFHQ